MNNSHFSNTKELIDFLLSQGYFALYLCQTEASVPEKEHYNLLKFGEKVQPDCYDIGNIPLLSNEGSQVIARYLLNDCVLIYPDPTSLEN